MHLSSDNQRRLQMMCLSLPILIALVGCQATASTPLPTLAPNTVIPPTPSLEVSPTQTATSTQAEISPSPEIKEPTSLPTQTKTPTPTPVSLPYTTGEFPLAEGGPWLLFLAAENHPSGGCFINDRYLWAINQNGSWSTKLEPQPVQTFAIRPGSTTGGAVVAYISGSSLKIMKLPSGEVTTITQLTGDTLKWSPDGSVLAFVGALNGNVADVYAYDYASAAITRLSDQPGKKPNLSWSPDGRYLVYDATWRDGENFHTTITAVHSDGSNPRVLASDSGKTGFPAFYTWLDATKLFLFTGGVYIFQYTIRYAGIHIVDVDTGDDTPIIEEPFVQVAYSQGHNAWLLKDRKRDAPLVLYQSGQRTEIPDNNIETMWWSSEYDVFIGEAIGDDVLFYTVTPDGQISMPPKLALKSMMIFDPVVLSPDQKWWGWLAISHGGAGRWVAAGAAWSEPQTATDGTNSMDFSWSPDSRYLIALDFFGLIIMKPPDFHVSRRLGHICGTTSPEFWSPWQAAWIP